MKESHFFLNLKEIGCKITVIKDRKGTVCPKKAILGPKQNNQQRSVAKNLLIDLAYGFYQLTLFIDSLCSCSKSRRNVVFTYAGISH